MGPDSAIIADMATFVVSDVWLCNVCVINGTQRIGDIPEGVREEPRSAREWVISVNEWRISVREWVISSKACQTLGDIEALVVDKAGLTSFTMNPIVTLLYMDSLG